jgi:glycosyltransferase involved in cell wall biosynthesis
MPAKVAVVIPGLTTSDGTATVSRFIYNNLKKEDLYQPTLISIATSAQDPASTRIANPLGWISGIDIIRDKWNGIPYKHVGSHFCELEFQRYKPRPQLTHLFDEFDLIQIVAGTPAWGLVGKNTSTPVALQVATLTSVERKSLLQTLRSPLGLWRRLMAKITAVLDRTAMEYMDITFVENMWMYDWGTERLSPDRVVFAPPGIDTSFFRPKSKSNYIQSMGSGDKLPARYLLSVGRFGDPRKNVQLLFRSFSILRRLVEDSEVPLLVLAGRSPPPESAWELAENLGIREDIYFYEDVSKQRLSELYRNATVFVLSSDEEGLGLVILEAMASGVPVVSTACGGPEISVEHGETGLLVPPQDDRALAEGVKRVLENPQKKDEMGSKGRNRAVKKFDEKVSFSRYLHVYEKMLSGKSLK